jgi:hypothetical protein
LAVFIALTRLIPWLGVVLALLPVLLVGWSVTPIIGIVATLLTAGVLFGLELLVHAHLFPRQRFSSLLMVLVLVAMAEVYGLIGIILAPPIAIALQILLGGIQRQEMPSTSVEIRKTMNNLNLRLDTLKQKVTNEESLRLPEILTMTQRLESLLEKTRDTIAYNINGTG